MKKHNHPIDEFFRERLKDYKMEPSDGAKGAFLKDAMQLPPPAIKGRKGLTLLLALISLIGAGIILWTITEDPFTSISDQASDSPTVSSHAAGQKTSLSKTTPKDHQNQPQQKFQQLQPQPEQQKQYFQQQPKLQQQEQSQRSQQQEKSQKSQQLEQQQPQSQKQQPQKQEPQKQQSQKQQPQKQEPQKQQSQKQEPQQQQSQQTQSQQTQQLPQRQNQKLQLKQQQKQQHQQQQAGATTQLNSDQLNSDQLNSDQLNSDQLNSDQGNSIRANSNQMNGNLPIVAEPSDKRSLQQPVSSGQTKPQSQCAQESLQPVKDRETTSQQSIQENPAAAVPVTPAPAFVTTRAANVSPSIRPKASVSNEVYHNPAEGTILTNQTNDNLANQTNDNLTNQAKDNLANQATGNLTNQATNNPASPTTSNPANLTTNNPANLTTSNPANQVKTDHANQAPVSVLAVKKGDSRLKPIAGIQGKTMHDKENQQNWIPDMGIYYTPEWMFNTLEGTKFVNNFGIEGTFHIGRFSIRTGAGLSLGKGTNELVVEYNDFLGTYNKLDSMSFIWNDPTHNYLPTMYLSKTDVWDSLMKLDYARIVKRYTYLQVPMIMGYDFWESDRIVLGVRLGPVMSILLASKQLSEDYEPGKKQIISVNAIAPEQVSLNWQVLGGLNAAYRLTDVLNIEIEPSVRYYFNSVYEKPVNNTKPWSVGVRAAFVVKL